MWIGTKAIKSLHVFSFLSGITVSLSAYSQQIYAPSINPGLAVGQGAAAAQMMTDAYRRAQSYGAARRRLSANQEMSMQVPNMQAPMGGAAATAKLLLFGGQSHREFLGCLTCSEFESTSVWNEISIYGWANEIGKWSRIGPYRSSVSMYSACNDISIDPPIIVDRSGIYYGRLSVNELASDGTCGISGNARICNAVRAMCGAP